MNKSVVLVVLLAILVGGCSSLSRTSPSGVDLTGVWRIDHEVSGNPATLPGIADDTAKSGKDTGDAGPQDLLAELQSQQLNIHQTEGDTVITYDGGIKRDYAWGARQSGKSHSGWQKTYFVVEAVGPGGHRLTRQFVLSDAGKSLTVVTVFNRMGLTQLYKLDGDATDKLYGKPKPAGS